MVRWLKVILCLIVLALAVSATAQTVSSQGVPTIIVNQLGGYRAAKWLVLPNDTTDLTTALINKAGQVAFKYPYIYWLDTVDMVWKPIISDTGSITYTAGFGLDLNANEFSVDTSEIATINALSDTAQGIRESLTLQNVTDNGNLTTKDIRISSYLYSNRIYVGDGISTDSSGIINALIGRKNYIDDAASSNIGVRGSVNTSYTTANTGKQTYGIFGTVNLLNTNTANWGTGPSSHPNLIGVGASVNTNPSSSGVIDYAAGLYSTIGEFGNASYRKTSLATLTYSGSTVTNFCVGLSIQQASVGSIGNTYLQLTGVNEEDPASGNWAIYTGTGVTYPSFHAGEFRIGGSTDLGAYQLQVDGAEVTTGLDNYNSDISGTFTDRSKIDKGFADATYSTISGLAAYRQKADSGTSGANVYVTPTGVKTIGDLLYQPIGAYVTSVTGTPPIASTGGTTPAISIADASADGTTKGAASFNPNEFSSSAGVISLDYTVSSGKYLPTITGISNVDAATADTLRYVRIGNVVQVSGFFGIDATTSGATTTIDISLPIATTLAEFNDAGGVAMTRSNTATAPTMGVYANAATNRARADYNAATTSATSFYVTFSYEIK